MAETAVPVQPAAPAIADPAPLGLAGFALTTFVLSVHNANWAPDLVWVGLALFYGGLAQFLAGQHEFRNRNTFGATAFSSYGAFWLALASFIIMDLAHALPATMNINNALGWFIASFAIFNTYMMFWSTRVNKAIFAVFLTLEATEIIYFIGQFLLGNGHPVGTDIVHVSGYVGVLTAACAWYASAAGVVNGMAGHPVVKVGAPLWGGPPKERLAPPIASTGGYGAPAAQH
ncbi:MAG TPA: acetate uptake transporter [Acidimicrobiales bacterium]|nr:acetate uptake transporter [Acidimicrobiales bacterium]